MGQGVIGAIHDKAFYLPYLAVNGVDMLVPPHLSLPEGNGVADHDRLAGTKAYAGSRTGHPWTAGIAEAPDPHRLGEAVLGGRAGARLRDRRGAGGLPGATTSAP